jgi:hypothetical protein
MFAFLYFYAETPIKFRQDLPLALLKRGTEKAIKITRMFAAKEKPNGARFLPRFSGRTGGFTEFGNAARRSRMAGSDLASFSASSS